MYPPCFGGHAPIHAGFGIWSMRRRVRMLRHSTSPFSAIAARAMPRVTSCVVVKLCMAPLLVREGAGGSRWPGEWPSTGQGRDRRRPAGRPPAGVLAG